MKKHPYTSSIFIHKWSAHFTKGQDVAKFDSIEGPVFLKKKFPPIYVNSGSNFTLQAFYRTVATSFDDLRKKTLIIYDVPDYFNANKKIRSSFVKLNIVKEYVGFLIDLKDYETVEDYVKSRFNSKNRSQFRSYKRKLEKSFPITYSMFHGTMMTGCKHKAHPKCLDALGDLFW